MSNHKNLSNKNITITIKEEVMNQNAEANIIIIIITSTRINKNRVQEVPVVIEAVEDREVAHALSKTMRIKSSNSSSSSKHRSRAVVEAGVAGDAAPPK